MRPMTAPLPWMTDPRRGALRIVVGDRSVPVREMGRGGLAVDADAGHRLPGLVHLFEGDSHVATGLICSDVVENGLHRFHFKRLTPTFDTPPRDFDASATTDDIVASREMGPDTLRRGL